jgi:hemolysin activation/secretion protein
MRRILWISTAAILVFPAAAWSQRDQQQDQSQQNQSQQAQQSATAPPQSQNQSQSAPPQQDSLAAAARKAREQKKETQKPAAKVFTNDNLPASGGISTVGEEKETASGQPDANGTPAAAPAGANDEKTWRAKFAALHHTLDRDQGELDVMQREASVDQVQFYGGDPVKGMTDNLNQQPFGTDYTKKLGQIDAKKKQVEADKQAIADAEDALRKAGGDPGWAH